MPASELTRKAAPADVPSAARLAFATEAQLADWRAAQARLQNAGYGAAVPRAFTAASLALAQRMGPDTAIALARPVSLLAIRASPRTATLFCTVAEAMARALPTEEAFHRWSGLIVTLTKDAPDVLLPLLERSEQIIGRVGLDAYIAWVQTGLRLAGRDKARRKSYFALETPEAQQHLERHAGTLQFQMLERQLKAELQALFGVSPPVRELPAAPLSQVRQRSSFASGVVQLPARYASAAGREADIYRAAVAHIGAHLVFGRGQFPLGQLKPLQVAVVSLIEDARVELLAMRQMPGLARLWRPLHTAPPEGARTATSLFARLARALIDPDFTPSDGWVRKGRGLFFAASDHWHDPGISRHIGNLLGNELGQLRVQFNAKNYAVAPSYRDDNMGLWAFPEDPDTEPQHSLSVETNDLRRSAPGKSDSGKDKPETDPDSPPVEKVTLHSADSTEGRFHTRLPEFDYATGTERPDWTTVRLYDPAPGDPAFWPRLKEQNGPLIDKAERMMRAARVGNRVRLRRQVEGEKLDLAAAVESAIEARTGELPNPAVYEAKSPPQRSMATHLLLDTSQSTASDVPGTGRTILEIERDAAALLALAMDRFSDPLAVSSFSSDGREDVRIVPIKGFDEAVGLRSGMAFSGLSPGYSTRLGAALRYAGQSLTQVRQHRRLVLVITDGAPSDIDVPDPDYLVADARRAVQSLNRAGIDCFGLALGRGAASRSAKVFGPRGFIQIDNISRLPEKLQVLYVRMTR